MSVPEDVKAATQPVTWKVFALLMAGALVGALAILPYALALQGAILREVAAQAGVGVPLLLAASTLQTLLLSGVATALGLWLGRRVGLGAPLLESWLAGEPGIGARVRGWLPRALGGGIAVGLLILLLEVVVFQPLLADTVGALATERAPISPLAGLLAAFYGGIVEELQLRLGVMTLFVWLGSRLLRQSRPGHGVVWASIGLAALLFGIGHLPALAAAGIPLTPLWVGRTLLLNGIGALLFGWLYWRHGLLAAMIAHFSADIVLHVLVPLATTIVG